MCLKNCNVTEKKILYWTSNHTKIGLGIKAIQEKVEIASIVVGKKVVSFMRFRYMWGKLLKNQ
jgi:hypothetical protein